MGNRTYWVDYAKAIGIILVVYGHVARGVFNAGIEFPEHHYRFADSVVYTFHMPLFFFLSGLFFCQSLSKRGVKNLIFNKIDTIVYPYIVWSIFHGSLEVYMSKHINVDVTFNEVLMLFWDPRAQFWFLYALFVIFVLSTMIYTATGKRHSIIVFILAAILYIHHSALPDLRVLNFISQNLVFFCFGIVFMQYAKIEYISNAKAFIVILFIFLLGQWLFHDHYSLVYTNKGVASLFLSIISIIFIASISSILAQRRYVFLQFIGISSMAIFLMHVLAGGGVRLLLDKVLNIDSLLVHISVGCAAGVLAPLLAVMMIDKFKIPYIFSAPICSYLVIWFGKALQRTSR
jgi:fucose 4-O-acetylase-like acetyltransferase